MFVVGECLLVCMFVGAPYHHQTNKVCLISNQDKKIPRPKPGLVGRSG